VNYIQQINSFEQWAEVNMPSTGQYALYYALLAINNRAGWKEWFKVANSTIETRIGMSAQGIRKARSYLVDHKLIEIQIIGSNKATLYKIMPFTPQIVTATVSAEGSIPQIVTATGAAEFPQQFPVLKDKHKETTTTADVYTKVFGRLMMDGLMSEYIMSLKKSGFTDVFIQELLLEVGESGEKPSLRYMKTIGDRWIKEGIYSRAESKRRKDELKGGKGKGLKLIVAHHDLPYESEVRAAERRKQEELDKLDLSQWM